MLIEALCGVLCLFGSVGAADTTIIHYSLFIIHFFRVFVKSVASAELLRAVNAPRGYHSRAVRAAYRAGETHIVIHGEFVVSTAGFFLVVHKYHPGVIICGKTGEITGYLLRYFFLFTVIYMASVMLNISIAVGITINA